MPSLQFCPVFVTVPSKDSDSPTPGRHSFHIVSASSPNSGKKHGRCHFVYAPSRDGKSAQGTIRNRPNPGNTSSGDFDFRTVGVRPREVHPLAVRSLDCPLAKLPRVRQSDQFPSTQKTCRSIRSVLAAQGRLNSRAASPVAHSAGCPPLNLEGGGGIPFSEDNSMQKRSDVIDYAVVTSIFFLILLTSILWR